MFYDFTLYRLAPCLEIVNIIIKIVTYVSNSAPTTNSQVLTNKDHLRIIYSSLFGSEGHCKKLDPY